MENYVLHSLDDAQSLPAHRRAVALGVFDGVHIGHRAVIHRAVGICSETGRFDPLPCCVLDFIQPVWQLKKGAAILSSADQRDRALRTLGVAERVDIDFDCLRNMSPEQFVRDVLRDLLHAAFVFCGENYHFGHGGKGDAALLQQLCTQYGICAEVVPSLLVDGSDVSSSRIRDAIRDGDVAQAARLLGRPITLDFAVEDGQHLGRKLGFPTINQPLPEHFVQPRFGVYASSVIVDGVARYGVTNIGVHPTVGRTTPTAETYIPGYDGNLYGQKVPVSLVRFLRPEQTFDSVDQLCRQIEQDRQQAQRIVQAKDSEIRAVLFDFDDTLQDFRAAFPLFADWFLRRRFPQLSDQKRAERVRFMQQNNDRGYIRWQEYVDLLKQSWDWQDAPTAREMADEYIVKDAEHIVLRPDALLVLQTLRDRGYPIGLVTNGASVMQHRKLEVCRLRPYLDTAAVSGEEGVHKPDPELFRRAAMRLGVPCQNCLFVGDHPINDMDGALAAGMHAAYLPTDWEQSPSGEHLVIRCLSDLLDYLPPREENLV